MAFYRKLYATLKLFIIFIKALKLKRLKTKRLKVLLVILPISVSYGTVR